MRSWHGNVFGRNWRAPPEPALCGNSTCYAPCGILYRGTDELLSTGRRIRPSLRRSSNCCTKQKAENGRGRALIQYLNGQGVLMTPCRFYFGCYIDTLCGRTLRNRMSGAAARHFFFSGKGADRVRLYWNQPTSQKTPRQRRGTANAAVGGAGASIAQMYICTACWGKPQSPMPPASGSNAAAPQEGARNG